tara:strand:+ start:233 stop:1492 length:1260 start_codon:yes stop_codon:yes gene_type:complete
MITKIYRSLFPILFLVFLLFGIPFSNKIREGFRIRRLRLRAPFLKKLDRSFWIHAASGEYEYARPLVQELKKRHPEIPIVVTFFSPTYMKTIDSDPLVDYALPLPFDFPGSVQSLIRKIRPHALFIARTDLWPEVLTQCRRFSIPRVLFSYHHSRSKSWWANFFRKQLLSELSHIDCVSEDSLSWVKSCVSTPATAFGDTRYDRVQERKSHPKPLKVTFSKGKRTITLGSTWGEDDKIMAKALKISQESWDLAVWAPHEPTEAHLNELKALLHKKGLSFEMYSELSSPPQAQVLILDQVGILFDLYAFSDLAFVGGSFRSTVHSVMEPLAFGNRVLLGPKMHNNFEAQDFQKVVVDTKNVVEVHSTPKGMADAITAHFEPSKGLRLKTQNEISDLVQKKSGASSRLLNHLESLNLYQKN